MGNNKPNKGELIFIILMFVIINGTAYISYQVLCKIYSISYNFYLFVIIDIVKSKKLFNIKRL